MLLLNRILEICNRSQELTKHIREIVCLIRAPTNEREGTEMEKIAKQ